MKKRIDTYHDVVQHVQQRRRGLVEKGVEERLRIGIVESRPDAGHQQYLARDGVQLQGRSTHRDS